jgi:hypothetical protein
VFSRAQALCEAHGVELSLKIVAGLYGAYMMLGDRNALAAVRPLSERLLGSPDPVADLTALSTLGVHAFWAGDHVCARDMLALGMPLYESAAFREYAETYGWDGGIYLPLYGIWNRAIMGEPGAHDAAVMAAAAASFDPQAPALVSLFAMATAHLRGDVAAAKAYAEHVIAVSSEQRFYGILPLGFCGHGLALATQGDVGTGLAEIGQGIDILRAAGAWTVLGYYLTYLAEAHLIAGDLAAGLAVTAEGLERCERELARVQEPELFRLEGELRARAGDDVAAEAALRRGLALAQARGARAWELRVAASLARFLAERGRAA